MKTYSRLAWGLRDYLHHNISLEESKKVISTRMQNRGKYLLSLIQKGIYGNPNSPYLKLLRMAGCEFGDIETMVNKDGIEATLHKLVVEGVYISWDEFKGNKDLTRGTNRFRFKESDFNNPFVEGHYSYQSSGTRSAGTRTTFDFKHQLAKDYYYKIMYAVNNALDAPMALWYAGPPSAAGINILLHCWITGKPVERWFSPASEKQVRASLWDRLALRYILYAGKLFGAKLAKPEYVSLSQAIKIAHWMAETKKKSGSCSLESFVSPAVMVCQAAREHGLDIRGTHFFVGGEPLTEAKRQQIEATGALVTPRYFISEIGIIGSGCPGTRDSDAVHLFHDYVALIQRQRKVEHTEIQVNAFLFTSILPTAPRIFLNVEVDDYGIVENVRCGCLFEQLGFIKHLRDIRSFSKLTGSGMNIIGTDFVRILEEVLPHKYGGAPTDYQLLEEEDGEGRTLLSLIVSPTVGEVDEREAIDTVLKELRQVGHGGRLAAGFWSQVNMLQVKRMYPLSSSGKITTLQIVASGTKKGGPVITGPPF